jgi:hypothetical protein
LYGFVGRSSVDCDLFVILIICSFCVGIGVRDLQRGFCACKAAIRSQWAGRHVLI